MAKSGFRIANHSYGHRNMTEQSARHPPNPTPDPGRVSPAGIKNPSRLMRPPYGAINRRVARAIRRANYVPGPVERGFTRLVRRWTGDHCPTRAARPERGSTNIVLQHDGITNSPNSVAAVPRIVRRGPPSRVLLHRTQYQGQTDRSETQGLLRAFEGREGQESAVGIGSTIRCRIRRACTSRRRTAWQSNSPRPPAASTTCNGSSASSSRLGRPSRSSPSRSPPMRSPNPTKRSGNLSSPIGVSSLKRRFGADPRLKEAARDRDRRGQQVGVEPARGKVTAEVTIRLGRAPATMSVFRWSPQQVARMIETSRSPLAR